MSSDENTNAVSTDVVPETNSAGTETTPETDQRQPTKFESFFAFTKSLIIRALVIYFISSFFRRPGTTPPVTAPNGSGAPAVANTPAWNMFSNGTEYDLYVYVSEDEYVEDFNNLRLFWFKEGLIYGDWYSGENGDGSYTYYEKIPTNEKIRNNGSIFMHSYIVQTGKSPNPKSLDGNYAGPYKSYMRKQLNKYRKQRYMKTKNLLTGETDRTAEEIAKVEKGLKEEIISYWHPNLTVNIVTDQTNWVLGSVPPPLDEYIEFIPGTNKYKPVLFANEFWNMLRDYDPINETVKELELRLTFQPLSLFKWQLYSAQAMRNKWTAGMFGEAFQTDEDDADQDTLKETLLETSPYLLAATVIVSILHSIFELLAFKNDIQFWNNRKSLEGLSVRSVFFNVFQSLIVLLFVLDNETNMVIRISCFIGLAIEVWKIHKVVDVSIDRSQQILGIFPKIKLTDKGSYVESSTREYDTMAFKYLSWACFPLLAGYAVYSLIYLEHKGWYSFILNLLYGFLLTFGFIMMTPQLFINYKLKSVAHLPWRMMSYKFLNTFIDDIFAFVIKMPTMYRLGCFRDDIVFIIFLYQRWIYKVDVKRVNEFGFSGEMEQQSKSQVAIPEQDTQEKKDN
ncbi:cleft lip and palate transmembrane protein 1 homolog [Chrysoperla carnea]|uniref:cleft lip and palate transmembrane protein 1 homolog n=1 Tax=Chrysoperla carnea TaxID=189513 RepID=UPI001D0912FA|nr:cleft lip and palate transmembrane protein 1 homolog [Chrysoperla carnea]